VQKVRAIELFDQKAVGPLIDGLKDSGEEWRVLLLPTMLHQSPPRRIAAILCHLPSWELELKRTMWRDLMNSQRSWADTGGGGTRLVRMMQISDQFIFSIIIYIASQYYVIKL